MPIKKRYGTYVQSATKEEQESNTHPSRRPRVEEIAGRKQGSSHMPPKDPLMHKANVTPPCPIDLRQGTPTAQ